VSGGSSRFPPSVRFVTRAIVWGQPPLARREISSLAKRPERHKTDFDGSRDCLPQTLTESNVAEPPHADGAACRSMECLERMSSADGRRLPHITPDFRGGVATIRWRSMPKELPLQSVRANEGYTFLFLSRNPERWLARHCQRLDPTSRLASPRSTHAIRKPRCPREGVRRGLFHILPRRGGSRA